MFQACTKRGLILVLLGFCLSTHVLASTESLGHGKNTFIEGEHYNRFPTSIRTHPQVLSFMAQEPKKIQVIEFFSYACYGCYRLQSKFEAWQKTLPNNIVFYRVPVVFSSPWVNLGKAYYTAKVLNVENKLNHDLFSALHDKKRDISQELELKLFFEEHQIPETIFYGAFRSFEVERQFKKGNDLSLAYQIAVSPALIINGPTGSYLTSPAMAKSEDKLFMLLNLLLEKEQAALSQDLNSKPS